MLLQPPQTNNFGFPGPPQRAHLSWRSLKLELRVGPFVHKATNTLNIRYPKDWANGDTSDERCRRRPLPFLHECCTDVLPFAATAQGIISVLQ